MSSGGPWVTATDLAEYAYCPRSHWYYEHPPVGDRTTDARKRADAGTRYHHRILDAERRRAEHGAAYWAALALGALLVVGGLAWIFRP
jgi:CRISPR/Cas system-associated exonuclease Cas4 (RecB family)